MKKTMTVIEKVTKQDESAVLTLEEQDGDRVELTIEREYARTGFPVGCEVTFELVEVKEIVEEEALPVEPNLPSSDVKAMLDNAENAETSTTSGKSSTKAK